ncbi:RNA polymerase sigma factor ShbA [Qaidamihabitans albus]|uniref:RNA polymerase sigma factor ShbA n=1 Tax=Qaidamihabitans albus TaxID=2795733 RepID=UPI0018F1BF8E|nr:RNA polymerase sigma factor ShbA [Qaidamihabitans albus]
MTSATAHRSRSDATDASDDPLNELARAAAGGDRAAADRLLATIRPMLVRYIRARIGRSGGSEGAYYSADDVAQEACLGVFRSLSHYQPLGHSFTAFAYRIASNKVVDHYRRSGVNRETACDVLPETADPQRSPEARCLEAERGRYLKRLLDHVTGRERELLTLRIVVGLSAEETARAIGSTPGAVRVAQHRALAKLRKVLTPPPR